MNWRIKGVIQKTLSSLPGGVALNDWLQQTVGGLRDLEKNIDAKVNADWVVLVGHLKELGVSPRGLRYVEIGTGWYPTLPICWHLAGATEIISFDLQRHLNRRLTAKMLACLKAHLPAIAAAANRPLAAVKSDYERLYPASLPFDYRAPADATTTGLPDGSVDVVFSNSVLEHVPKAVIAKLMNESQRILRPGGLSIHSVNCGDHYAYFDHQISFMNYLSYPEDAWRFWNNDLQYQNRLRPQDFTQLAEAAGLEIALEKHKPRTDLLAGLPTFHLAAEFQHYPPDQLCATSVDFVARKT